MIKTNYGDRWLFKGATNGFVAIIETLNSPTIKKIINKSKFCILRDGGYWVDFEHQTGINASQYKKLTGQEKE